MMVDITYYEMTMPKRRTVAQTAIRVVQGLKLSFGLIAVTIAYAAVITPVLTGIINSRKGD